MQSSSPIGLLLLAVAGAFAIAPATALAAAAVAPVATAGPAAGRAFDRQAWLADYASLKQQLETNYANLAWFGAPDGGVDLPKLDRSTKQLLQLADTDDAARAALLSFVRAFHDGHLRQRPPLAVASGVSAEPPKPALEQLDADQACAAIGVTPGGAAEFSLPIETLSGFTLLSDGVSRPFRMGIFAGAGGARIGVLRIARFREKNYPSLCKQVWGELKAAARPVSAKALLSGITEAWPAALAAQLGQLQDAGVGAVLVDVGGNGGGNDTGDASTRLFTAGPVHSAPLLMVPALAGGYLDEQLRGLRRGVKLPDAGPGDLRGTMQQATSEFEGKKALLTRPACDMSWVWREQRPWAPLAKAADCSGLIEVGYASGARDFLPPAPPQQADFASYLYWPAAADAYRGAWRGPVYVLADNNVFSSAEMFVASMRDNHIAKIVGAPTGGAGCGNMQAQRIIELAHSRLRFQAPDCVRLRADGSDEVAGVAPDLPLLAQAGESDRARALRLFSLLDADLAMPVAP